MEKDKSEKSPEKKFERKCTKKHIPQKKNYSEDYIMSLIKKTEKSRTKNEIRILADYLSEKFDYFKKIKQSSEHKKLEKIVSVLHYEIFHKGDPIISYGEDGDKFYILLEGKINLFKPIYPQKKLTLQEYIIYLNTVKNDDKTGLKFDRIVEKNKNLNIDIGFYMQIPVADILYYGQMKFFVEEYEKLGEFQKGFAFGEIALIKKTKRNATIIAVDDCKLVSINKSDYNKIMKELELKRLEKELRLFKKQYSFFSYWNLNHLIKLFNAFSKETLYNTDYLYKQNEESDYIYIIKNGSFDLYCFLSLGWIDDYYNYIEYNKSNLVNYLIGKFPVEEEEIQNLFNEAEEKKIESPMKFNPYKEENPTISNPKRLNFLEFEQQQIKNFDKYNLFKIKIKTINDMDIIGFEDALELKNRFYFVKCVSEKAEILKISIKEFHKLMSTLDNEKNKHFFIEMIKTRKDNFLKIIKHEVDIKLNRINNEFENTFNDFLQGKGKFSYDKLENKKKSKYVVKQINYHKNKKLNSERLMNLNLQLIQNFSHSNIKIEDSNGTKIVLPNLTYSNFHPNNSKIEIKEIINSENNIKVLNTVDSVIQKENNSNSINQINKLNIPFNLKTLNNKLGSYSQRNYIKNNKKQSNNKLNFNNSNLNFISLADNKKSRNKNNNINNNNIFSQTTRNTNNIFNTEEYKKSIEKNEKFLTTEVIKLTGLTRIIPKNIIKRKMNVNRENSENFFRIEPKFISPEPINKIKNIYNNTNDQFSQGSFSSSNFSYLKSPYSNKSNSNKSNRKTKLFINNRIKAELRMKDFRSIRFKKKDL